MNYSFLSRPFRVAECTRNSDCDITEACINRRCQHPCDAHNPCAQNAVCMNANHVADCSCVDGYQGNGFIGCQPGKCRMQNIGVIRRQR